MKISRHLKFSYFLLYLVSRLSAPATAAVDNGNFPVACNGDHGLNDADIWLLGSGGHTSYMDEQTATEINKRPFNIVLLESQTGNNVPCFIHSQDNQLVNKVCHGGDMPIASASNFHTLQVKLIQTRNKSIIRYAAAHPKMAIQLLNQIITNYELVHTVLVQTRVFQPGDTLTALKKNLQPAINILKNAQLPKNAKARKQKEAAIRKQIQQYLQFQQIGVYGYLLDIIMHINIFKTPYYEPLDQLGLAYSRLTAPQKKLSGWNYIKEITAEFVEMKQKYLGASDTKQTIPARNRHLLQQIKDRGCGHMYKCVVPWGANHFMSYNAVISFFQGVKANLTEALSHGVRAVGYHSQFMNSLFFGNSEKVCVSLHLNKEPESQARTHIEL